ncbi:hypothetical protein [Phormidium tenue]|uniref:Uncharacterized protein n=1 Tax=Phormidium tenue FACHB-1050 TaxID=2692857 RepID=A0ABR8C7D9_9CYAN|nr:hypothetical protein [Phormidium tenue]MBD2316677.1 hypothetical protein [Phormidium tenue FACHB-1050]
MATDTHQYKAKNCTKGIPCGIGCISASKKCRTKLPSNVSASLDAIADPENLEAGAEKAEPSLTDKFPSLNSSEGELWDKTTKIGDNEILTYVSPNGKLEQKMGSGVEPPPTFQDVIIVVNDNLDKSSSIEGKEGLKLALASREHVREYVKQAPEGTILSNTPHKDDGFGDQRAKLYEKAGFSPRSSKGEMYSIVSGGKNIPITLDEIKALKEAGHFTK